MSELMRKDFKSLVDKVSTAHAGLLIQKSLPIWQEKEKAEKERLLNKVSAVNGNTPLYELAFNRWLSATSLEQSRFATVSAQINGRLLMNLGTGGSLETGAAVHHTYGVPYISGSSVKGAVRAYAQSIGLDAQYMAILFGYGDEDRKNNKENRSDIKDSAGYLIWHDAWWVPQQGKKPFISDIVTVHHQDYYSGKQAEATDFDSPVPNQQLAVQGGFYFCIEGDEQWVKFAKQLLENTITQLGLGAKGASGYGYFEIDHKLNSNIQNTVERMLNEALPEHERILKDFEVKISKTPKGQGMGSSLVTDLKNIIKQSSSWPSQSYPKLKALADILINHVGGNKKSDAVKSLKRSLPEIQE